MHVPGVKQEQPFKRPPLQEPVVVDMVIRDANRTKIVRVEEKRPEDVVRILNSILQKMNSNQKVFIVEEKERAKPSESVSSQTGEVVEEVTSQECGKGCITIGSGA